MSHDFYPFAVTLLQLLHFVGIVDDGDQVTDTKRDNLNECGGMKGPSIGTVFILNTVWVSTVLEIQIKSTKLYILTVYPLVRDAVYCAQFGQMLDHARIPSAMALLQFH